MLVVCAICAQAPVACTSADPSDGASADLTGADAIAACYELMNAYCAAEQRCGSPLSLEECRVDARTAGMDCDAAQSARASYDQCIAYVQTVDCSNTAQPAVCMNVVTIGPPPPPPQGVLGPCFATSSAIPDCDAYCASVGQQCQANCAIWDDLPSMFAGIDWTVAGVCPASEEGLAVPTCDTPLVPSFTVAARCCCA